MRKLIYVANARIPTEKAHGIQIMKMCEAFARKGIDVELVVPRRRNLIKADPFEYYGIERNFKIKRLPTIDLVGIIPKLGFWIESIAFSKFVLFSGITRNADIVYSRDVIPLYFLSFFKRNIWWEAHLPQKTFLVRRIIKHSRGIITISRGLKDFFVGLGANFERIIVAHDGVDLSRFDIAISKEEARKKVGLSQDRKIILYTGHLYEWKGADMLLKAARALEPLFVFVGGTEEDLKRFKKEAQRIDNVLIVGHKPHKEIPYYLKAADVLVLPNTGKNKVGKYYTSPMKLFEYMASGRPIVASDLPAIREVLSDKNAILVEPDDPTVLAEGIKKALRDQELLRRTTDRARVDVEQHTWQKRAEDILDFIKNK